MSKDQKAWSRNQRSAPYGGKQEHWGDRRVWWFVVLAQGRVFLVPMDEGWQQNGDGMAVFVAKRGLRKLLRFADSNLLCAGPSPSTSTSKNDKPGT